MRMDVNRDGFKICPSVLQNGRCGTGKKAVKLDWPTQIPTSLQLTFEDSKLANEVDLRGVAHISLEQSANHSGHARCVVRRAVLSLSSNEADLLFLVQVLD